MHRAKRLYPIILAIAAQAMAALILVGIIQLAWKLFSYDLALLAKLALQSLFALGLTYAFRLPRWWLAIQASLPFLFYGANLAGFPAWTYLALFIFLVLLFWNSADDQVPLYLTNNRTADCITNEVLPRSDWKSGCTFLDLGCGPAGLLIRLAKTNPGWHFTGIETAPLLWCVASLRVKLSGLKNVRILRQNLWQADISNTDILYAFLSPAPMAGLYKKVNEEASPGAILISNSFTIPDVPADDEINVSDNRGTTLFLWRLTKS